MIRRTAALGAATAGILLATSPALTAWTPAPDRTPVPTAVGPATAQAGPPATAAPVGPSPVTPATPMPTTEDPAATDPGGIVTADGNVVAPGSVVAGTGAPLRYTVEVAPATGLDPTEVAATVDAALGDPRSWARIRRMERVEDGDLVDARIVVAPPAVVDALCAEAGLDTAGVYSCWNGRIVALNAWRWEIGAVGFPDVPAYRTYLVNHEVGHVLGLGHVGCPGEGALAPLMMQQSKGLDGCVANGWPYPEG